MIPVACVSLSLLLLTGCVPHPSPTLPSPEPTSTPVFASDEEALAAAEAAYREYEAEVDRSLSTYDQDGLPKVATGDALSAAIKAATDLEKRGQRQTGTSTIDSLSLVAGGAEDESVQIYACLDVSGTDLVDGSGKSVVPSGRPTRFPVTVNLDWSSEAGVLLVSREEVWDGKDFCS